MIYGNISPDDISLNPIETSLRLKTEKGYTNSQIEECFKEIKKNLNLKYIAERVKIKKNGFKFDLGFGEFESKSLEKNLGDCNEAFVFLITLGFECDRLLNKLSYISPAKHFICDALASSLAESVCDKAEEITKSRVRTSF